jgi:hypothetical protein
VPAKKTTTLVTILIILSIGLLLCIIYINKDLHQKEQADQLKKTTVINFKV